MLPTTLQTSSTILGKAPQVHQTVGTLVRLTQAEDALPKGRNREECIKTLGALWEEKVKKIADVASAVEGVALNEVKEAIVQDLIALDTKFTSRILRSNSCTVSPLYIPEIQAAQTTEELHRLAFRFFKDAQSLSVGTSPLKKSLRGKNGPTYLISYSRLDPKSGTPFLNNYVIKWGDVTEFSSARLYEGFSRNFDTQGRFYTFIVPDTALLDLDRSTHEMPDSTSVELTALEVDQLKSKFMSVILLSIRKDFQNDSSIELNPEGIKKSLTLLSADELLQLFQSLSDPHKQRLISILLSEKMHAQITKIPSSEMQQLLALFSPMEQERMQATLRCIQEEQMAQPSAVDNQILLMEKIPGSNLFDFAMEKYAFLSDGQKEKLFERLGRLAFLDVILGNLDRLIQVCLDADQISFNLTNVESNLGNIMIVWSGQESEFPELYAIDNGIDPTLIENPQHKEKYIQFLKTLLSNPTMVSDLTMSMAESIQTCLNTTIQEEAEKIDVKKFKPFSDDLKDDGIGRAAIARGITQMTQRLQTHFIPNWDSENSTLLKNHLSKAHPELLQAVSERLETLKSFRT